MVIPSAYEKKYLACHATISSFGRLLRKLKKSTTGTVHPLLDQTGLEFPVRGGYMRLSLSPGGTSTTQQITVTGRLSRDKPDKFRPVELGKTHLPHPTPREIPAWVVGRMQSHAQLSACPR